MLTFSNISKRFGGVQALKDVSFHIDRSTIHAIVGENGAGKSTLMKILSGVHGPDTGTVTLDGKEVVIPTPRRARELGIALVPQEPALCPNLTVEENLSLGYEPARAGFVNRAETRRRAEAALKRAALPIPPDTPVERLSAAQKHLLQIARALAEDAKILILDEPTAALSEGEAANLFERLRALKAEGVTILYISHRLPEIFLLCDAITTLRDGSHVATLPVAQVTPNDIVAHMVGREVAREEELLESQAAAAAAVVRTTPLFECKNLTRTGEFENVSFSVYPGEIVGMAGLVGSGRSEIARVIFGLNAPTSGTMTLEGKTYAPRDPRAAIRAGVAMVPEDRRHQGLVMQLSVRENTTLAALAAEVGNLTSGPLIKSGAERATAQARISDLGIKTSSQDAGVSTLSGGNAQKVVIGKWLTVGPRFFIVDEPTQGVDVGAKAQVHRLMVELAAKNYAVLMISSDLPEVLHLSHRILVMREGHLAGQLPHGASPEDVMRLAALGDATKSVSSTVEAASAAQAPAA